MGCEARKPIFGFLTKKNSNQLAELSRLSRPLKFCTKKMNTIDADKTA